MTALIAGTNAPDFNLPTMGAQDFSLADALRRGPVVLAFFKISCPVCQYALPFLERLYQSYRGKDVAVVGVSQNPKPETDAFRKQYGITFPIALDHPANYRVSNAYGLTNVPTIFLVAPSGSIEVSSVGWSRADVGAINAKIAEYLKGKPAATVFPADEEVAEWKAG